MTSSLLPRRVPTDACWAVLLPDLVAPGAKFLAFAVLTSGTLLGAQGTTCPGEFKLPGYGSIALTSTADGNMLDLEPGGKIMAHMDARTYFADSCTNGQFSNTKYSGIPLLGKVISYTTDVSGAGCGCNAAFYLVSMKQNPEVSSCNDFYCDANKVCGIACAEIDIQEANKRAWHSTLHSAQDSSGVGGGYGGGDGWNGPRDFSSAQYGPGSTCIDTTQPIDVAAAFPVNAQGKLTAMEIKLTQKGKNCLLKINLSTYAQMEELSAALDKGMTPVISYWKSDDMLWMDGKGADSQGPCKEDAQRCGVSVSFWGFKVEPLPRMGMPTPTAVPPLLPLPAPPAPVPNSLPAFSHPVPPPNPPMPLPVPPAPLPAPPSSHAGSETAGPQKQECSLEREDCRFSKCCVQAGAMCYQKNNWWAACKMSCTPGIDMNDALEYQQPWSCEEMGPRTPGGPAPQRHKEIILRIPWQDVPNNLKQGIEVSLLVDGQRVNAKVVTVNEIEGPTGGAIPGGGSASAIWGTILIFTGLGLLVAGAFIYNWYRQEHSGDCNIMETLRGWAQASQNLLQSAWSRGGRRNSNRSRRRDSSPSRRTREEEPASRPWLQNGLDYFKPQQQERQAEASSQPWWRRDRQEAPRTYPTGQAGDTGRMQWTAMIAPQSPVRQAGSPPRYPQQHRAPTRPGLMW